MNRELKKRDPYFCNIKFILILLVVLGHLMERYIYIDHNMYILYAFIYMVHMPLFAFVSGYFSKNSLQRIAQTWKIGGDFFILHVGWLPISLLLTGEIGNWKCPYWYFWYLLSLFCWKWMGTLLLYLEKRMFSKKSRSFRLFMIMMAIAFGCFSGALSDVGRDFSLSRTLVLFPFYYIGLCCPKEVLTKIKKLRFFWILPAFCMVVIGGIWLLDLIPVTFLYHAEGFGAFNLSLVLGLQARLVCYILAALLGLAILALTPNRQCAFSKFGVDTMLVYMLHGLLMPANLLAPISSTLGSLLYFSAISMGFIFLVYQITYWKQTLVVLNKFSNLHIR